MKPWNPHVLWMTAELHILLPFMGTLAVYCGISSIGLYLRISHPDEINSRSTFSIKMITLIAGQPEGFSVPSIIWAWCHYTLRSVTMSGHVKYKRNSLACKMQEDSALLISLHKLRLSGLRKFNISGGACRQQIQIIVWLYCFVKEIKNVILNAFLYSLISLHILLW